MCGNGVQFEFIMRSGLIDIPGYENDEGSHRGSFDTFAHFLHLESWLSKWMIMS